MKESVREGHVEILRDHWGVPHVFAAQESDGFFGLGYASAEDRLLQMVLLRRRVYGRIAEVHGAEWIDSDRKFRIAGIPRYCAEAFANMPEDQKENLRSYAAGVNAFAEASPDAIRRRFGHLGIEPDPWTPADCIAAWLGVTELFDVFVDDRTFWTYGEVQPDELGDPALKELYRFQQMVKEVGLEEAFERRGRVSDDEVAHVPESEMAKFSEVYARLKSMKRTPGFRVRAASPQHLRFSHAWVVDGERSETGKPILESEPRSPVNNPAIWYEFHLIAGRYNVRGVGVAGSPAVFIGFNKRVAWGCTGLGAGCTVNFMERLSEDAKGFQWRGKTRPFDCRLELIEVKDAEPVVQEVYTNHHGFVFNSLARGPRPGEAYVSHYKMAEDRATSVRAMLEWMQARNWTEFVAAMEHYYSPGAHLIYADVDGNIAYQTLVQVPLTKRSPRWILEGWTGEDEVLGRIPLEEMPHMLNPDAHFIYSANHMPVGSWYPHDINLVSGTGEGPRAMRLRQLLQGDRVFSMDDFQADLHRDDVNPVVAALLPIAQKLVEQEGVDDPLVGAVLQSLKDWDLHYNADDPAYGVALILVNNALKAFRSTDFGEVLSFGWGGVCHLARLLSKHWAETETPPENPEVRAYLIEWLRMTGEQLKASGMALDEFAKVEPHVHPLIYQSNQRIGFPSANPAWDTVSPSLKCGEKQTIWSQRSHSYSQIVDLSEVDNSLSVLPPGVSEDPESPFYLNQMELWCKGETHPAPLSRDRVEALAVSHTTLRVASYEGSDFSAYKEVKDVPEEARYIRAIPEIPSA